MKKIISALIVGLAAALGLSVGSNAAFATGGGTPHKWYVCKYVGKPGVNERLQTGQNPIFVDESAIDISPVHIGATFADKQGRSIVVAGPYEKKLSPEPGVGICPNPDGPPSPSPSPSVTPTPTPTPSPSDTPPPTDWNWKYDVTCTAVSGTNPNGPIDSVDSNIRIKNLDTNEVRTFNYHPNTSGPASFSWKYLVEYGMPESWTHYEVQWVQVNGTNYHWEGKLTCGESTPTPTPTETPTPSPTPTEPTVTPSPSETPTVTPTPTPSETDTPTPSPTPTGPTVTPTPSETPTPTVTPTPTETPTTSPSPSVTPSKTPKPSATPEHLAFTGGDINLLWPALGIILLGAAAVAVARKR